jgi:hypothetical protein
MSALWLAGVDTEATLGFNVTDLGNTLDGAMGMQEGIDIPTLPGVVLAGPHRTPLRQFTLRGYLDGADQATVRANLAKLKALLGDEDTLTSVRLGDWTTVQIDARCKGFKVRRYPLNGTANSLNEVPVAVEMDFEAPSPFWEDTTATEIAFTTSAVSMPQGTAPSEPVLTTAAGAATTPTITAKDKDANTLWTCTLASLTSGQRYRITTARGVMTVEKYTGSAWESAEASITAGIFPKPLPSSGAGYLASSWPTLQATAGSWTATYNKRWR